MRAHRIAILIATLHLVLAFLYSQATPYRTPGQLMNSFDPQTHQHLRIPDIGAPDEREHANYVQYLLEHHSFPVLQGDMYENYEFLQPPAYYVLDAVFARIVGVHNVTDPEGARLRWLNAAVGFGTVIGVYCLGFWGFRSRSVACGAAAFAAFLPMHCALDGAISNDPLLYCGMTWTVALLAKAVRDGWDWKTAIWIGVAAGISLNTKTTALLLLPTILIGSFLGQRSPLRMVSGAVAIALALALPWWLRNNAIYPGDPLVIKKFLVVFHNPTPGDLIPGLKGGAFEYWTSWFGWWTTRSFFGTFGYMDIFLNSSSLAFPPARVGDTEILYRLLLVGLVIAAIGWCASLKKEEWRDAKPIHFLNFTLLFFVLALFLRFNLTFFQAQGRYLIPAIGPIACGVSVGICHLSKTRRLVGLGVMAATFLIVNAYALNRLPAEFELRTHLTSP